MPSDAAAARLTELIEALPRAPAATIPSRMIAAHLVALLPKGKALDVRSLDSAFAAGGLRETQVLMALCALAVMILIILRGLSPFFAWARERRESATASRRRGINNYATLIKTGSETH